jgi:hypothetical protein
LELAAAEGNHDMDLERKYLAQLSSSGVRTWRNKAAGTNHMKRKTSIQQLLRWRLAQSRASSPPAPKAAHLLRAARPWWEKQPKTFESQVEHLKRIKSVYGHTLGATTRGGNGNRVPALIVRGDEQSENYARITYFDVPDTRLLLSFKIETALRPVETAFEVTFISEADARPLFCAVATVSAEANYVIETEVLAEIASEWGQLKLRDPMPFRLVLYPEAAHQ